jgi:hypothetical protein
VPANEKARAEQMITQIRELVKNQSTDVSLMRQSTSDLQQLAHALAANTPTQGSTSAAHAGGSNGAPKPGVEDVIDAEFKQTK